MGIPTTEITNPDENPSETIKVALEALEALEQEEEELEGLTTEEAQQYIADTQLLIDALIEVRPKMQHPVCIDGTTELIDMMTDLISQIKAAPTES
jgi:hypothetical protein